MTKSFGAVPLLFHFGRLYFVRNCNSLCWKMGKVGDKFSCTIEKFKKKVSFVFLNNISEKHLSI